MGVRGTLVATVLLILAAIALWLDQPAPSPVANHVGRQDGAVDTGDSTKRLVDFQGSDVIGVAVSLKEQTRSTKRLAGGWSGTDRPALVDDFLNDLSRFGALAEIDANPATLPSFGLEPPRAVLTVEVQRRPQPTILKVGNRNPSTTGVYVQLVSGRVVLVGALLEWELEKMFNALAID